MKCAQLILHFIELRSECTNIHEYFYVDALQFRLPFLGQKCLKWPRQKERGHYYCWNRNCLSCESSPLDPARNMATVEKKIMTYALGEHGPESAQDTRTSGNLWRPIMCHFDIGTSRKSRWTHSKTTKIEATVWVCLYFAGSKTAYTRLTHLLSSRIIIINFVLIIIIITINYPHHE